MVQYSLSRTPTSKEESNPHLRYHHSHIKPIDIKDYGQLREVLIHPQRTISIGTPLEKYAIGNKLVTATHKNADKDGYFPRVKDTFSNKNNVAILDVEVSDVLGNKCDNYRLTSKKKLIRFMSKTYPQFKNYFITKSFSQIVGKNNFKWHIYIIFDTFYEIADIKKYIISKLPKDSFCQGMNKNGHKQDRNAYVDIGVLDAGNRLVYEHPEVRHHSYTIGQNKPNSIQDFKQTVKDFTEPTYRAVFSDEEIAKAVDGHVKRYAKRNKISKSNARKIIKSFEDGGMLHYRTKLMLGNGKYRSIKRIIKDGKQIRLFPPLDEGIRNYGGAMAYYPETKTFRDYHNDKFYATTDNTRDEITFSGKIKLPAHVENVKKFLLIAPTGSGKTYSYESRGKTIVLVPKRAQVMQHRKGMDYWKRGEWEIFEDRATFMTYKKFYGHMSSISPKDLSGVTVVLDEVHVFGKNAQDLFIFEKLVMSDTMLGAKKLVITSATVIEEYYQQYVNHICIFKEDCEPTKIKYVQCDTEHEYAIIRRMTGKVLVFNEHRKSNEKLKKYLISKGKRVLTVSSSAPVTGKMFSEYDIVITTSAIREGFSINEQVDDVVVLGGGRNNATDIVQSVARPRVNKPMVTIPVREYTWGRHDVNVPSFDRLRYAISKNILSNGGTVNKARYAIDSEKDLIRQSVDEDGKGHIVGLMVAHTNKMMTKAGFDKEYRSKLFNCFGKYELSYEKFVPRDDEDYEEELEPELDEYEYLKPILKNKDYEKAMKKLKSVKTKNTEEKLIIHKAITHLDDLRHMVKEDKEFYNHDYEVPTGKAIDFFFKKDNGEMVSVKSKFKKRVSQFMLNKKAGIDNFFGFKLQTYDVQYVRDIVLRKMKKVSNGKFAIGETKLNDILERSYDCYFDENKVTFVGHIHVKMRGLKDGIFNDEKL